MKFYDAIESLRISKKNHFTKWNEENYGAKARLAGGYAIPKTKPSFALSEEDKVFTIGSCFARNIEESLLANGEL